MTDLETLDAFVCENPQLAELETKVGRFNLFDALGIARAEIRHSNFLAWLLDPNESHGRGDRYLKAVLMDLFRRTPGDRPLSPAQVEATVLSGVEVRREWRHIDLLLVCRRPQFVVAVENKVDTTDSRGQLERYEAEVGREFPAADGWRSTLVYLTPDGSLPNEGDWNVYSYGDLHRVLERLYREDTADVEDDVSRFVSHYLHLLRTKIMDDEQLHEVCRTIYKTHRQAIDLIVQHGMDRPANLVSLTAEWVRQEPRYRLINETPREVVFVPAQWFETVPPIAAPLGGKQVPPESWLRIHIVNENSKCRFFVYAAPATNERLRKQVVDAISGKAGGLGFKRIKTVTPRWTRLLS